MSKTKAVLFDITRNSYVDGPGIRTTVFFKGCNLRCAWCHNPESQECKPQITKDQKIVGRCYTVEEVFKEVRKDKAFYNTSGGGVTFSGGECMLQINFLLELLRKCKEEGIHTAIDTAGNVPWESFEKVMPYTDLFLYDIKTANNDTHKKYTGVENALILENAAKLLGAGVRMWIRIPIIPGVNNSPEEIEEIRKFLIQNGYPEKLEILPYHSLGEHKYKNLGRPVPDFSEPQAIDLVDAEGLACFITDL